MKKAVLLDIDGTILDAWGFVFNAVRHSLTTHGYPYPAEKNIKKAMGRPLIEFYELLLPETDPLILAKTHQKFQEDNFHLVKSFPKAKKTLQNLKNSGFLVAAVSNRTRESLLRSLKVAEIFVYFDTVVGADDVRNPKPHKEHLLVALNQLKVTPANAYMVGDTDQDIVAGKSAKVKTVGVTYGFLGPEIKKYNPDYLMDDIEELLEILKLV